MSQIDRINGLIGSIAVKAPCRVATTANITLSGEQTIDDVTVVADDRVYVNSQTDGIENGIYDVSTSAWTRAKDWNGARDVVKGTLTWVHSGTANTGWWYVTTADDITVETTSVAMAKTSSTLAVLSAFAQTLADDASADAHWVTLMATLTKATARTSLGVAGLTDSNIFTKTQSWAKGSDIASAAALPNITDGNYADVTGTTAITSIVTTGTVGTVIKRHFDGILTLTNHATNLILPHGFNITTYAGYEAEFVEYASGDFRLVSDNRSGRVVQVVNVQDGVVATGTTPIPTDDTIPQNDEGDEYMTLAITPTNSSNKLKIEVVWIGSNSNTDNRIFGALFQDSTADALAAGVGAKNDSTNVYGPIHFTHYMTAGATSEITFKVRAGTSTAGTTTFNGVAAARVFGGVMASSITITEIA